MRALWLTLACAAYAPTPPPRGPVAAESPRLRRGETLVVQLDRELRTGKVKPGDSFTARIVTPVRGLPADARVAGTVVEARRGSAESEPELRLHVDELVRGPCRLPLDARIASVEMEQTAKPVSEPYRSGAIAGAVTGGLMWVGPGALLGFNLGLAAGAVRDVQSLHEDARIAQGALLQLQLTAPLDVRSCSA
jgi:hypothetical protein